MNDNEKYRKHRNAICQLPTSKLEDELRKEQAIDEVFEDNDGYGRLAAIEDELNARVRDASDPAVEGARQHAEDYGY